MENSKDHKSAAEPPLDCRVRRLPDWHKHTADEYANADPFEGDESELACRTVTIRKARKDYLCFGLNGRQDHGIQKGTFYRHERARVDGSFWGEYRICLQCIDALLAGEDDF